MPEQSTYPCRGTLKKLCNGSIPIQDSPHTWIHATYGHNHQLTEPPDVSPLLDPPQNHHKTPGNHRYFVILRPHCLPYHVSSGAGHNCICQIQRHRCHCTSHTIHAKLCSSTPGCHHSLHCKYIYIAMHHTSLNQMHTAAPAVISFSVQNQPIPPNHLPRPPLHHRTMKQFTR
jgi:hypothetical protein